MACWGPAGWQAGCPRRAAESGEPSSEVLAGPPALSAGPRPAPRVVSRGSREASEKSRALASLASSCGLHQRRLLLGWWVTVHGDAASVPTGPAARPGKEGHRPQPADVLQPGHRVSQARGRPAAALGHEGEWALPTQALGARVGGAGASRTPQASVLGKPQGSRVGREGSRASSEKGL